VLLVDDDEAVARAFERILVRAGYEVHVALAADRAIEIVRSEPELDAVLSDISMPGMTGIELLRAIRETTDLDVPVLFVTGNPSLGDAVRAVEYGAFRFLEKPIRAEDLCAEIGEAVRLRRLARSRPPGKAWHARSQLETAFRQTLPAIRMAYQPIASASGRDAYGYEGLMRSPGAPLPTPIAVLDAAEKLGALHLLGRHLRAIVAADAAGAPVAATFFVNVHPADLADPELYDAGAPLSWHAQRVVLEITERASLEAITSLEERLAKLRRLGYRIAIDDLGAGYAGLSYFARVKPELVKLDMSLTRGIEADVVKQRVVQSVAELGKALDFEIVAEGIETAHERDMVVELGARYVQGYALARPGPPFPSLAWP
jgi:EAL domain-containing protein (putative c-di-GMP-specific phosphodiesterase class I)